MTLSDVTIRVKSAVRLVLKPRMFSPDTTRDVFLVSYPRSGNTWLRSMIAQLVTKTKISSLRDLDYIVPDVHYAIPTSRVTKLPFYVVKSHEPLRLGGASEKYRRIIYVVRDPRDVAVSWHRYLLNNGLNNGVYDDNLDQFVSDFVSGRIWPGSWQEHVESWTHGLELRPGNQIMVLRYEDIIQNTIKSLTKIAYFLDLRVEIRFLNEVVGDSSVEEMRKKEVCGNRPSIESGQYYLLEMRKPGITKAN